MNSQTAQSNFDALRWINGYFYWDNRLKYEELKPVFGFCLLWGTFEAEQCKKCANPKTIEQCVNETFVRSDFSMLASDRCLGFFRTHFFYGGMPSEESLGAFFRRGEEREQLSRKDKEKEDQLKVLVCRAFTTPPPDHKQVVQALLLLTWRVRNHLFHGIKELDSLPRQIELFNQLNLFLTTFLDEIRRSKIEPRNAA